MTKLSHQKQGSHNYQKEQQIGCGSWNGAGQPEPQKDRDCFNRAQPLWGCIAGQPSQVFLNLIDEKKSNMDETHG